MAIKTYKTTRSARKHASITDRREWHRGRPFKKLVRARRRMSGRGASGQITVRHRGGGAKRALRIVDFGQDKQGVAGTVERIEYDPNRSAPLALVRYDDGERRYVLAWHGCRVGQKIVSQADAKETVGNRLQLQNITPGLTVFNVEMKPNRGGKLFRSAGASATVMDVAGRYAQLQLPSGEIRLIPKECYATLGQVGNTDWRLVRIGSAGRSRRRGRRPAVRGKAMNPVDHPHGGGEGAQPIGLKHPKTPWGKPALGVKTRPRGKYSDALILRRRTKKKRR